MAKRYNRRPEGICCKYDVQDLLADRQWHTEGELGAKLRRMISDTRAVQVYHQNSWRGPRESRDAAKKRHRAKPPEALASKGRTTQVKRLLRDMIRSGEVEVRGDGDDREFRLMIYRCCHCGVMVQGEPMPYPPHCEACRKLADIAVQNRNQGVDSEEESDETA